MNSPLPTMATTNWVSMMAGGRGMKEKLLRARQFLFGAGEIIIEEHLLFCWAALL